MKRFLFLVLPLLFWVTISRGQGTKEVADPGQKQFTVVCLGDSITHAGYPAELEKLIPIRAIDAGVNGNTSRQGLARLERDVLRHKPDVVVLFFGANDSRQDAPQKHVPLPEYKENLSSIIERCQAIGAKVVLGTVPPIEREAYYTRHPKEKYDPVGGLDAWLAKYRAAAMEVGQAKAVTVVDLNQLLLKEPNWRQADGVHPTEEGNRILARLFSKEVEALTKTSAQASFGIGIGAKPIPGADVILDGSEATLHEKWTYWEGPRFGSSLPIKWKIVDDPVDGGKVVQTYDPAAAGGKFGAADIVTKKAYRDFRLHVEFLVGNEGGNSGVYLQNRYEIQICDGDKTRHGMGTVINETESPYHIYKGLGKWNSYDINFRAARFHDGKLTEKPLVTIYFNGVKVHTNQVISQVWGGPNSGIDGGNDEGKGITDTPAGLKLQNEGHDVRYRNIWIKELDLVQADTDF